jgi:hypothetical protein
MNFTTKVAGRCANSPRRGPERLRLPARQARYPQRPSCLPRQTKSPSEPTTEGSKYGYRVECDWCRRAIPASAPYVTVQIDGKIIQGHPSNDPEDVGGPARVYCGLDRYDDADPAANGVGIGGRPYPRAGATARAAHNGRWPH